MIWFMSSPRSSVFRRDGSKIKRSYKTKKIQQYNQMLHACYLPHPLSRSSIRFNKVPGASIAARRNPTSWAAGTSCDCASSRCALSPQTLEKLDFGRARFSWVRKQIVKGKTHQEPGTYHFRKREAMSRLYAHSSFRSIR
jgi:hypothetical protein